MIMGYNCSMIIYKITNKLNGKTYIGQTIRDLEQRFIEHTFPSSGCKAIRDAIKKYGEENFSIEELAKASSQDELNKLEKFFIETRNTLSPNGYNLKEGGDAHFFAPETLEKMRQAKLGTSIPEEVRAKMSSSHKQRFEADPQLAAARSEQSKTIWEDEDYRANIREKRKEFWSNPENRQAASERAKTNTTDELKKQISLAVKISLNTPETKAKMTEFYKTQQREVIASDGREFTSIKEAASTVGCSGSSIIKNIQGRYKSVGGLTWKYKDAVLVIKPVLYLVCGVSGSGKSWVCNQLNDVSYLPSDSAGKKNHVEKLLELSKLNKPLVYDLSVGISTFIKRNIDKFDIRPVFIVETKELILERLKQRATGTALSDTRIVAINKRAQSYATFSGTSQEVLDYLNAQLVSKKSDSV